MTTTTTRVPAIAVSIAGDVLTLTFAHAPSVPLTIAAESLTPEIRHAAMMHGLKQKLVDAAAISRNPDTGLSATPQDKASAVYEVAERLLAGQWNKGREGGAGNTGGLLLSALVRLYEGRKSLEILRAYVDGLTNEEQAALRANSRIAPIIATIKAERDAKKGDAVDGDALLAGLDNAK